MIKAIIFDMDGVISDTDKTRFKLLKIILEKRGLILEDKYYKKSVGKRTKMFLAEMFPDDLSDDEIDKIYYERISEFHKNPEKYIIAQPFVKECCELLIKEGFVLTIASVSRKKDIILVLNKIGIQNFFTYIISSDNITHMKPDPEIYLKAIDKLGMQNNECIAIEDSPNGVRSAKSAGIKCIGVTYTHSSKELINSDYIIANLKEINKEFIREINSKTQ